MKNTHVISILNDTDANFEILKKKIPKRITQKFKKLSCLWALFLINMFKMDIWTFRSQLSSYYTFYIVPNLYWESSY